MRKRIAALLVGGVLAAGATMGLAACGKKDNKLVLWGPSAQQESLKQMVELFKAENPDFKLDIEVGVAGEGDAYSLMSNDPQSGADVFAYANDQVINLYSLGALARLSDATVANLKSTNDASSVEAGKVGDNYYGYPYAADNGFFMYYDSSIISADQAKNLNDVLDACADAGKYFIYQLGTGWYVGSFMYGAGGEYSVTYEGTTVKEVTCNFDQKPEGGNYTYGELGGQALIDLRDHDAFKNGDDDVISTYITGKRLGACITGTWKAGQIKDAFGDNYAATVLPNWTSSLDGKTYDWKSFAGYKLYGVNSFSKHLDEAHQLAAFLSGEKMQEKRFDDSAIGPSNKAVAELPKVKQNVAIAAVNDQIANHSVVQTALPTSYWNEMESFGKAIEGWDGSGNLLTRVQELVTALKAN